MPSYMEDGKTYKLTAAMSPPYYGMDPSQYVLAGQWTLPDGTVTAGSTVNYTPTDADAAAGVVEFKYTAWVEGYQDKGASVTLTRKVRVGKYIWPSFEILQSQLIQQAPSTVTLQVNPVDYKGGLESPKYTWSFPAGAKIISNYGARVVAQFPDPGTFDVTAHIVDARGSQADATTQVVTIAPTPWQISAVMSPSNKDYHEPLNLVVWPKATGGHPQDRMTAFTYTLNGTPLTTATNVASINGLTQGHYDLQIQGTSLMGVTASADIPFDVLPNDPPTCQISQSTTLSITNPEYILYAQCTDDDGYLVSYRWSMDGKVFSTASRVGVPIPKAGTTTDVALTVTDNAGGTYQTTVTLSPQ